MGEVELIKLSHLACGKMTVHSLMKCFQDHLELSGVKEDAMCVKYWLGPQERLRWTEAAHQSLDVDSTEVGLNLMSVDCSV